MHFALLGDHPDGIDMAHALVASGRHQLSLYSGPSAGRQALERLGLSPRPVSDLEEVLADHAIDLVIVAGSPTVRASQLRRAMQAECHVLCVHPADPSPDLAYEAGMIQADTGRVLLPLLPMPHHPGLVRFAQLRAGRLVELEIWSSEEVLLEATLEGHKPGLPGWDVLRFVGGEIAEVSLLSGGTELLPHQPCLLTGRFARGGLFQATYVPHQAEASMRLSVLTTTGRVTLRFPRGWPGASTLTYLDDTGVSRTETWDALPPWHGLIERFEHAAVAASIKKAQPGVFATDSLTSSPPRLGWQDELRALELDDAVRRSVERGRTSTLDLQQATEEASFKGTMTLVGCSLIWLSLVVLILSAFVPWIGWLIVPVFGLFLVLQGLRWVVPTKSEPDV